MKEQFHPTSNLFPLMEGSEFDELVDDIKANGQREPIWLHPDGSILDGRNRYNACIKAGIEPQYRTWDGHGSAVSFVLSENVHRRHLDASQRAAIAAEAEPIFAAEAKERQKRKPAELAKLPGQRWNARDDAAKSLGVSPRYVQDAKAIKKKSPVVFDQVKSGKKKLQAAKRELKITKPKSKPEANEDICDECLATLDNRSIGQYLDRSGSI